MPDPQGAPPAQAGQQQEGGNKWQGMIRTAAMFIGIQFVMKYGMEYMGVGPAKPVVPQTPAPVADSTGGELPASTVVMPKMMASPSWDKGTPMSMLLYVNTADDAGQIDFAHPTVQWDDLTFGNWKDVRDAELILDVPEKVRADNGSWWMDILLVKDGGSPTGRDNADVAHHRKELTRWMPKKRIRKEKSLLSKDENTEEEEEVEEVITGPPPITSYWSRNLTVTVVTDSGTLDLASLTPPLQPSFKRAPAPVGADPTNYIRYYPPIFVNDFWLLKENLIPINSTTTKLPVTVTYHAISNMKFNIFASMTVAFDQSAQQQGSGAELDEVKRMLTETNPILLVTTVIVTMLHMLFEFLAFSSDIGHWRKKDKDLVGVSLNTILTNCFVQLVILLYLHDSSEETSWMILFTQGIGLLIEAWKITKVVDVRVRPAQNIIGYTVVFEDKHELSEDEKKTQEYDRLAFKIVSWFALPLLLGYAGYSLMYQTHRSWYSFIVTTLAQAIYMFGFVQLIPQLIINYKLKSVAHIPMKAMVYKTLSTVVDDFFAFCIKMPWLHRLACFRDDVVFLVLLYQRWIYRVDYSRVNEYGQVTDEKELEDKSQATADPKAVTEKVKDAQGETKKTK